MSQDVKPTNLPLLLAKKKVAKEPFCDSSYATFNPLNFKHFPATPYLKILDFPLIHLTWGLCPLYEEPQSKHLKMFLNVQIFDVNKSFLKVFFTYRVTGDFVIHETILVHFTQSFVLKSDINYLTIFRLRLHYITFILFLLLRIP